jgi:tRNA(fMet)-specific endonuclease VapC
MSFLIDTDICSAFLRGDRRVGGRFMQYAGRLNVSSITVAELYAGAFRLRASRRLASDVFLMLQDLTILDVTYDVAYAFGSIRAPLLDRGLPAPSMDLLIAATALAHGLTLVTHNTTHYASVSGISLLDWLAP